MKGLIFHNISSVRFLNLALTALLMEYSHASQRATAKEMILIQVEIRKNSKDNPFLNLTFRVFLLNLNFWLKVSVHYCSRDNSKDQ